MGAASRPNVSLLEISGDQLIRSVAITVPIQLSAADEEYLGYGKFPLFVFIFYFYFYFRFILFYF